VALWHGIVATNYLYRWGVALHPYQKVDGALDEAKREALQLIRLGMREANVFPRIREAVEVMSAVPTTRHDPGQRDARLKVGIVGDLYTRANPYANQDLYGTLEHLGCEVLAPPFVLDGQLYDLWDHPIQHMIHGRYSSAIKRGLLSAYQLEEAWRIRRLFPDEPEIVFDGSGLRWRRDTTAYFNSDVDGYLTQNLGKAMDFIRIGADGILNVMCHNCMVGLASDAVISDFRRDHGDVPYLSLSYDSLGDVHLRTRIEAFVDLLRSRRP
jgi:predicted nucleotide-binding protein (sugar kinase/HSP70/actin superfamily)